MDFFDGKKPVMTCKEWKANKKQKAGKKTKEPSLT
jgi:hypothetical protein